VEAAANGVDDRVDTVEKAQGRYRPVCKHGARAPGAVAGCFDSYSVPPGDSSVLWLSGFYRWLLKMGLQLLPFAEFADALRAVVPEEWVAETAALLRLVVADHHS
jgi:hypothetical protein